MELISIIIPTYNEAENIKKIIPLIASTLINYDYEIIVVDDNSPDRTAEIARELAKKYPIRVFIRKNEKGLASAIVFGFKMAKGDILCAIDADLQHPPSLLKNMIDKILKGYDIVIASRYVSGSIIKNWPMHRQFISKLAIFLAKPLTDVKDPMSGFFVLKRKVIEQINFKPRGYKILLEILTKGRYERILEVPYTFQTRSSGSSKMDWREIVNYILLLLHLYAFKLK